MPRNNGLDGFVDHALLRARLVIAAEAAAAGIIVAAWSVPAGFAAAVVFAAWRARAASRPAVLRALERADPRSRNLMVTADELSSGHLIAKPSIRERVETEAAEVAAAINPQSLFPLGRLAKLLVAGVAAWSIALAVGSRQSNGVSPDGRNGAAASGGATSATLRVSVTVDPPGYTNAGQTKAVDPLQLEILEHSIVRWSIAASSDEVAIEINGDVRRLSRSPAGTFNADGAVGRSGYALVTAGSARRMIPIAIKPDALPAVRLSAPGRDLIFGGGNPRIEFGARATDDYGLRALTLRYTKVSGSGEQFEFVDGEIPLAVTKTNDRSWSGSAGRSLAELGLAEGDMLVYRAVAADQRASGGEASSDAFFIEVSRIGVAAGDAFTLPEQETRYALSQQMLIVKTDRLNQRRAALDAAEFAEAAQNLAVEQRMIRSEFVFMLGGEIEDEEVEAEQSVEIQAGRLVNRGQRDIRSATIAMSQAEKLLTGADTANALKAERAAVEALQRAFARDRYILRALATRSQLDLNRRLTGTVTQALGWRRHLQEPPENRRAALLQSLLEGIGQAASSAQVEVLAEMAIRIDSGSAPLRDIAAALQRLADQWAAASAADRAAALDAVARAAAEEARRALADPPVAIGASR